MLSAVQVYDAAREQCPDLGLTTVYRTLDVLVEVGALRRVHGDGHCGTFAPVGAAHGHTVLCDACGRVTEFTACDMRDVVAEAARETGYRITDHFLQLSGICTGCRSRADADPEDDATHGRRGRRRTKDRGPRDRRSRGDEPRGGEAGDCATRGDDV